MGSKTRFKLPPQGWVYSWPPDINDREQMDALKKAQKQIEPGEMMFQIIDEVNNKKIQCGWCGEFARVKSNKAECCGLVYAKTEESREFAFIMLDPHDYLQITKWK